MCGSSFSYGIGQHRAAGQLSSPEQTGMAQEREMWLMGPGRWAELVPVCCRSPLWMEDALLSFLEGPLDGKEENKKQKPMTFFILFQPKHRNSILPKGWGGSALLAEPFSIYCCSQLTSPLKTEPNAVNNHRVRETWDRGGPEHQQPWGGNTAAPPQTASTAKKNIYIKNHLRANESCTRFLFIITGTKS